ASAVMSSLGILGVYIPFTGEPNIDMEAPAFALPFDVSHEMSHQRGFTREDEANFLAWLVGRDAVDVDFRYSSAFFAQIYVARALRDAAPDRWRTLHARVPPGVLADAQHWYDWVEHSRTRAANVADSVNDAYLKSQGAT